MPLAPPTSIEVLHHLRRRHRPAVDRDDVTLREGQLDRGRRVRGLFRRDRPAPHRLLGLGPGILEDTALVGDVQQVGVHRVGRLRALLCEVDRDAVLLRIVHQLLARQQVPLAPGRDDLDVGLEGIGTELEADLVVALAGGAVGDGVGAGLDGDLDQPLGDQRARDRGAEQVLALVDRVGAEHREHEVARELLAQVVDVDLLHAHGLRLGARRLELLALTDVGGEGHDLAAVDVLQPLQDHRGVEAAGIGQDHLLDARL